MKTRPKPLPTRGRGLTRLFRGAPIEAGRAPRVFSPLVGEMAGRPERVYAICESPEPAGEGGGVIIRPDRR
jgi:hypothetical protein